MPEHYSAGLAVDLCGIRMSNPLIVAAGPFGAAGDKIRDVTIPRAAPGAVETKVIFTRVLPYFAKAVSPAAAWTYSRLGGREGEKFPTEGYTFMPGGPGVNRTIEQWAETEMATAVAAGKAAGVPVFANGPSPATEPGTLELYHTSADAEIERMTEYASKFEQIGAAAVQALFHALHVPGYGWPNWPYMPRMMAALKKTLRIPVIAKLPYHPDIVEIVKRLEGHGADAVILTGITGQMDMDIETGRPWRPTLTASDVFGGAILKPAALWSVAVCHEAGVGIPLIASGGAFSARDVIAYVMAGAAAVHVLTAAMFEGLSYFKKLNSDVLDWLEAHGHRSLSEIRGTARTKWGAEELKALENVTVEIDDSRCDGCGKCLRYCAEVMRGAIAVINKKARIDPAKCHRCTSCSLICPPEKGAIQVKGWPSRG